MSDREDRSSMTEMLELAGVRPRGDGGPPAHPMPRLDQPHVIEHVHPRGRITTSTSRRIEEGKINPYENLLKMREGLDRASRQIQRAVATVKLQQASLKAPSGNLNERIRASGYRADQELATALESLAAASEALEALDQARREGNRNSKESRRAR